jgi:hypothetical protein
MPSSTSSLSPYRLPSPSFFRDLAELIGQVKPPVATKEDIEKSGLAVFKASALPEYSKAGKIASNTVEKVLYVPL